MSKETRREMLQGQRIALTDKSRVELGCCVTLKQRRKTFLLKAFPLGSLKTHPTTYKAP